MVCCSNVIIDLSETLCPHSIYIYTFIPLVPQFTFIHIHCMGNLEKSAVATRHILISILPFRKKFMLRLKAFESLRWSCLFTVTHFSPSNKKDVFLFNPFVYWEFRNISSPLSPHSECPFDSLEPFSKVVPFLKSDFTTWVIKRLRTTRVWFFFSEPI